MARWRPTELSSAALRASSAQQRLQHLAAALAVGLVLALGAVDLVLGREQLVIGTFVVPVILAAATQTVRVTTAIAALSAAAALALLLLLDTVEGSPAVRMIILGIGNLACVYGADRRNQVLIRARELAAHERRFRLILETADEGVAVLDADGRLAYANTRIGEMLGLPLAERIGRSIEDLLPPEEQQQLLARMASYRASRGRRQEVRHRRADGQVVHLSVSGRELLDEHGRYAGMAGFYTDITRRRQAERQLLRMSLQDSLTGLANRALLRDRLAHVLSRREQAPVAVLLLDLDQFNAVNNSLGHELGDQLLRRVAARLLDAVRPFDTVARLGGDEFVLVCPDIGNVEGALAVAERVEALLARPIVLSGLEVTMTASIGISIGRSGTGSEDASDYGSEADIGAAADPTSVEQPSGEPAPSLTTSRVALPPGTIALSDDGPSSDTPLELQVHLADQLVREADAAMYAAKQAGRARAEVYREGMSGEALDRLRVSSDLRAGLARHELRLYYQPIVDIGSGRTFGVESLVRWQHPERGLLLPGDFLSVAEDSGLLLELGGWVLRTASQQGATWQESHPLSVSVNLAVRQLLQDDLPGQIRRLLDEAGLEPERLTLEVTETALIADLPAASAVLEELRDLGVRLSLDDFGTGYSSLAYLRHLPVHELKLDRSFLVDLTDPQSEAVVSAVIDVAHALDMTVVGEGVENADQLAALERLGCDLAQGYLCGRPAEPQALQLA